MADIKVAYYITDMRFRDEHAQIIIFYDDTQQEIGDVVFTDPALFSATIGVLRNEGPHVYWDEDRKRLSVGLEPVGEGES